MNSLKLLLLSSFLLSLPLLSLSSHECTSLSSSATLYQQKTETLILKLIAIASILVAGGLGILIPILGRKISYLKPESDAFFVFRALAAGVILATGLVHILPSAFDNLTSPCLRGRKRWQNFPVAGFVAMGSAIGTMMVDSFATGYYKRSQIKKAQPVDVDDDDDDDAGVWGVVEAGAGGHVHGGMGVAEEGSPAENIRHRVISQVLELGILVHSVIIGISLGTSSSSSTIRPLLGALSFHQFFEGIGLGGCIVQAKFRTRSTVIMAVFFSLTTPIGIALGIAVSSSYNDNSSTALVVEGIFNAAAAGILVYMALVNLLATDFMSLRLQSNLRLQLGAHLALLLGASSMSLLAIWA